MYIIITYLKVKLPTLNLMSCSHCELQEMVGLLDQKQVFLEGVIQ